MRLCARSQGTEHRGRAIVLYILIAFAVLCVSGGVMPPSPHARTNLLLSSSGEAVFRGETQDFELNSDVRRRLHGYKAETFYSLHFAADL